MVGLRDLRDPVTPFYVAYRKLTREEVVELNTTPLEIIPQVEGFGFIPVHTFVRKFPGAYVKGAATHLQLRQTNGSGLQLTSILLGALPQFDLTEAGYSAALGVGPGSNAANYVGIGVTETPVVVYMNGGNVSGPGGALEITCYYLKAPLDHVLGR